MKKSSTNLIRKINKLKHRQIRKIIDKRIREFKKLGKKSQNEIFKELCFCLLTANFDAKRGIEIQKKVENGFLKFSEKKLATKLKRLGYRFPNARAKYIANARKERKLIEKCTLNKNSRQVREILVKNIKGLGYKESSHFLRNIGFDGLAIIDFHIIDLLVKNKLIERPKTLNKEKYLKIEKELEKISRKTKLTLAKLDLYLWFIETGRILK